MANPAGYVSAGAVPVVPTGYEMLQQQAAQKRKLSEMLLAQGLAGPGEGARSWTQLLASLAQTWAGKSLGDKATKLDGEVRAKQLEKYQTTMASIRRDLEGGADPSTIYQRYGGDPMVKEFLEPYTQAVTKTLETRGANSVTVDPPVIAIGPDGKRTTVAYDKSGGVRVAPGGYSKPEEMSNVNGVALALQAQKPGALLPADPTDSVIRGKAPYSDPNVDFRVNTPAVAAKQVVAAASAPANKVMINTADTIGKGGIERLGNSADAADSAIKSFETTKQIREALGSGKVISGPGTLWSMAIRRAIGDSPEKLAQTRTAIQGLAQLVLNGRTQLKGQGAVSDSETNLLKKATSDDIDKMSPSEILQIVNISDRTSRATIARHQRLMGVARKLPGAAEGGVELFDTGSASPNKGAGAPPPEMTTIDQIMEARRLRKARGNR